MVAEEIGVPLDAVHVVNANTDVKPWDVGVHASRTTFVAGNAARMAAAEIREQLLGTASEVLGAPVEQLRLRDGTVEIEGDPERQMAHGRLVRRRLLREQGSVLMASAFYDPPTQMQEAHRGHISAAYGIRPRAYPMRPWKVKEWLDANERSHVIRNGRSADA